MSATSSPAGPSRHRRKHTAENWDDDFEFALPARTPRPSHKSTTSTSTKQSAPSRHLESTSGASRANQQPEKHPPKGGSAGASSKAKEADEDEDWDAGGEWEEDIVLPTATRIPIPPSRTSIQVRRGSRGPTPLIIPSGSNPAASKTLGLPRSSSSSTSPLPSPSSRTSPPIRSSAQLSSTAAYPQPSQIASSSRISLDEPNIFPVRRISRHPSTSFAPPPTTSTVAVSNDSSSSLISWTKFDRSSPNLVPTSLSDMPNPQPSISRGLRERELRHMKSGEIMPPPPLPSLLRRKSKKGNEGSQAPEIRESQVPFSPSMEQLKGMEGKRGFWKRLSGNASGLTKGSPTSVHSVQEIRRRRSSSVGSRSPTKNRPNLSPSGQPPLPPLPLNVRSPSAASATSTTSATSSQSKPTGLAGILRRSTSSLIRNLPPSAESGGSNTPPSSYTPPTSTTSAMLPIPIRTSSRNSQMSLSNSSAFANGGVQRASSISRGYHLPSPSSGSPYQNNKTGYFDLAGDAPPLPHSASLQTALAARAGNGRARRTGGGGSITGTDTESESGEADMAQVTPKRQRRIRPVSALPLSCSTQTSAGWGGDGWTGFPSAPRPPPSIPTSVSARPEHFPLPPSRTSSHTSSRIPSSQSTASHPELLPTPTLNVVEDAEPESSRSFSTLRRLSSLSKKHGRRISGGWKFGTGSSTSTNSSTEEKRNRGRLETVAGSPVKAARGISQARAGDSQGGFKRGDDDVGPGTPSGIDRNIRGESVSAPNSILKPPPQSARDLNSEWDPVAGTSAPMGPKAVSQQVTRTAGAMAKADKERRRQSWNDFVIPQNVLEKQREVRRGIEGVKRFASGVETLKTLLATHSDLSAQLSTSSESHDLITFSELDREFGQWWEMATVLIEVGSTGQASPMSPEAESPKRSRRVTLASDEAKAAADMMRRSQSTPQHPPYILSPISPIGPQKDLRKTSQPDPKYVNPALLGGPPRASPDLWRASTGRQELSKRQLEVLRTMLRTPVSDSSVPSSRNDGLRGMNTISASSTSTSLVDREKDARGIRHVFRPSISRVSTTDSRCSDTPSVVRFDSPEPHHRNSVDRQPGTSTPVPRSAEMFPSPNDSAYIVPSQSFPSPITASTLAYGVPLRVGPSAEASKMRRGSKVGLAGLKEFIKGLKTKESKKELRTATVTRPLPSPLPTGLPRPSAAGNGLTAPLSPTSPTSAPKYPFAWRHRPNPSMTDLHQSSLLPPPSAPRPRPSRRQSIAAPYADPVLSPETPTRPTAAGPPVSGKERKRPGLRGIFRAGSGSWGDLVRDGEKRGVGNKENVNSPSEVVGLPYPRVGSGGSTGSAPVPLRHSSSIEQFGAGKRSTSGPSQLTLPSSASRRAMEVGSKDLVDDSEMRTLRPQRKSRIMGLGWPEEAAAARDMGRLDSNATFASGTSEEFAEVDRRYLELGSEVRDSETKDDAEEDPIALTPESLPVLLEYLRQCEGKLGEWRERVRILEGQ